MPQLGFNSVNALAASPIYQGQGFCSVKPVGSKPAARKRILHERVHMHASRRHGTRMVPRALGWQEFSESARCEIGD